MAVKSLEWNASWPTVAEWELIERLIKSNLLLITLEIHLKVFKQKSPTPGRIEEQQEQIPQ